MSGRGRGGARTHLREHGGEAVDRGEVVRFRGGLPQLPVRVQHLPVEAARPVEVAPLPPEGAHALDGAERVRVARLAPGVAAAEPPQAGHRLREELLRLVEVA